jgi:hypothetical protein
LRNADIKRESRQSTEKVVYKFTIFPFICRSAHVFLCVCPTFHFSRLSFLSLFIYLVVCLGFTSHSRFFSLIWRRHHCRWRAAKYSLCLALRTFEQGWIFIVPHLLWHEASVFSGLIRRTAPFSRLLRHTRGCEGYILTWILTGPLLVASYDTQGNVDDLFLPGSSWMSLVWILLIFWYGQRATYWKYDQK